MIKINNPFNGANVDTSFVAAEDEKRNKEGNVTNAKPIKIPVNGSFVATEKEAKFLLETFKFLKDGGKTEEKPVEVDESVVESLKDPSDDLDKEIDKILEGVEPVLEEKKEIPDTRKEDDEKEFKMLKEVGFLKLKGSENLVGSQRHRYIELRDKLKVTK